MPNYTENYNLIKQEQNENYDRTLDNANLDIIDQKIKEAENAATDVGSIELPELNTDDKELTGAINEINTKVTEHLAQNAEDGAHGLTAERTRKITFGTAEPAGGEDGDIYLQYE